ncbi:MAG: hypothetical protein ACQESV_06505, partial [Thermodesulfobacteriota bacterium]
MSWGSLTPVNGLFPVVETGLQKKYRDTFCLLFWGLVTALGGGKRNTIADFHCRKEMCLGKRERKIAFASGVPALQRLCRFSGAVCAARHVFCGKTGAAGC